MDRRQNEMKERTVDRKRDDRNEAMNDREAGRRVEEGISLWVYLILG